MTEPLSPLPAAPPPRGSWMRATICCGLLGCVGVALFAFAEGTIYSQLVAVLELSVIGPLILLVWSRERTGRQASETAWKSFRLLWTSIWLGAVMAVGIVFGLLREWDSHLAESLRLALLMLLGWTSLLVLTCHRTLLKRLAFVFACLATLVALFYAVENWLGRRAWERFRAEWEPQGAKFSIPDIIPPPVSDERNVAMHPLFRAILDYRDDPQRGRVWPDTNNIALLESLTAYPRKPREITKEGIPSLSSAQEATNGVFLADMVAWQKFYRLDTNFAAVPAAARPAQDVVNYLMRNERGLAVVEEALARPDCRYPLRYDAAGELILPHLADVKRLGTFFFLRSTALLETGSAELAWQDLERGFRVAGLLDREPFQMCQFVQMATEAIGFGVVSHGLARHGWSDQQLGLLERKFGTKNKPADLRRAVFTESGYGDQIITSGQVRREMVREFEREIRIQRRPQPDYRHMAFNPRANPELAMFVLNHAPTGWLYREHTRILAQMYSGVGTNNLDTEHILVRSVKSETSKYEHWSQSLFAVTRDEIFGIHRLSHIARAARLQVTCHQIRIAVALERHWLRHRAYPEKLDALVPEFLDRLPHDLFDGQPMRYRREGGQGFVLWSVGFDGKDDNAGPLLTKPSGTTHTGEETGDLVWRYPQSP